jgi:acetyl esterase/lipase
MGNATADYGVHHVGRVNAFAAIAWVKEHFAALSTVPDSVFVTGESAGAVATYAISPWVFSAFPAASHYMLADSYAPVFGTNGYNEGFKNWNGLGVYDVGAIPYLTHAELYPWRPLVAASNTNATARAFPNATFASYISNDDATETGFYVVEGGGVDGLNWAKAARDALAAAHDAPNFASFIAKGTQHVVTYDDSMWEKEAYIVGGSKAGTPYILGDWIVDMLEGKAIPMTMDCKPHCFLEE